MEKCMKWMPSQPRILIWPMVISPITENYLFCVKWFLNILRKQALCILPLKKSYSSARMSSHCPKDLCGYWPCCPARVVKGVGGRCYAVACSGEVICSSNREVMEPDKCWQIVCLQLRQQSRSHSGLLCCCWWTWPLVMIQCLRFAL